jgi:hypothetical protein
LILGFLFLPFYYLIDYRNFTTLVSSTGKNDPQTPNTRTSFPKTDIMTSTPSTPSTPPNNDVEKGLDLGNRNSPEWGTVQAAPRGNWRTRFVDSFKRDPNAHVTKPAQVVGNVRGEYDHKAAAERTANSGLAHKLKGRHMQMIAIGGSIGSSRILT